MRILTFFILTAWSAIALGNGLVGNGGEGVRQGGKVVVRDLYEMGIESPFFGADSDLRVAKLVDQIKWPAGLDFNKVRLAQKLTHLNKVYKGLGDLAPMALLEMYNLSAHYGELPLTPDDSNSVPQDSRVQLALRYWRNILIAKPVFDLLDQDQKIALLIHELLYSFLKVTCENGSCEQKSILIREIVGRLFQPQAENDERLKGLISRNLNIPLKSKVCSRESLSLTYQFWQRDLQSFEPKGPALATQYVSYWGLNSRLTGDVDQFCHSLAFSKDPRNLVTVNANSVVLVARPYIYTSPFGAQQGLYVATATRYLKKFLEDSSAVRCSQDLSREISNWLLLSSKSQFDLANYCPITP